MAKQLMTKKLIFMNFDKNDFLFFDVDLSSAPNKKLHLITRSGKLGNEGSGRVKEYDDFTEAKKAFLKKIYDKKLEGYVSREKMKEAVSAATAFFQKEQKEPKDSKEAQKDKSASSQPAAPSPESKCGGCAKPINYKLYAKINEWARGEGNWDHDPSFVGYKKVLCLDCQVEHDIFKKKLGKAE